MAGKRIDYKTAMRSAIDARHQPGDIKAPGKPGSVRHVSGAGIEHPQNKVAPGTAGKGTDGGSSGAKGGPSPHPQNLVAGRDAGVGTDAASAGPKGGPSPQPQNRRTSSPGRFGSASKTHEVGGLKAVQKNSAEGPRAIGPPTEKIPHAGRGTDAKSSGSQGGVSPNPLNLVKPTGAGGGTDAASAGPKGGPSPHPQNKVLPVRRGAKAKTVAKRRSASSNLKALSKL